MSAGALGGGAFAYLKPIDFCKETVQVFKGKHEDVAPLLGQWLDVLELTGLHQIGYLAVTVSSYIGNMFLRLDVDGIVHDFEITGGSGGTPIISNTNSTNAGGLSNLTFKDYCKMSYQVNTSADGASANYDRSVTVSARYVPAVVESVS
ncbi:hypothetical protein KW437_22060 [Vibrio fluvialis]|nr:hypothetical protein [Vibrio fluvialis]